MSFSCRLFCCVLTMTIALSVSSASADVLGWWSFEGISTNVPDLSNLDHDGVIRNMPAELDDGNHGFSYDVPGTQLMATSFGILNNQYALHLNGTNDYVEITNNFATLDLTNNPSSFTLEMFVKLDRVQYAGERLVHMADTSDPDYPYAQIDTWFTGFGTVPRPAASVMDNQTDSPNSLYATDRNPPVLSVGKWHHLAFVKTGAVFFFYVDYQLNGSNEWTGMENAITNLGKFIIGSAINAPYNCFDGSIDEVRFSDTALAPQDFIRVVRGLPPIMRQIDRQAGQIGLLFSSDTSSVYVVESAPPGANSGPWSNEGSVTGAEFYSSWVPAQTNVMRQYRVQRRVP